jgi:lipoate-protein ligase B
MPCTVYNNGLTEYSVASRLQKDIRRRVIEGEAEDTLILLEHQPTITIGKSGKLENVLVSEAGLAEQGIALFFADRGGDVTYHGPGQLVAYPIINLKKCGVNAHQYVHDLEEVMIRTLSDFSIQGCRDRPTLESG